MPKKTYDIGEKVFFRETGNLAGEVLGVNEIYWSCDKWRSITYFLKLENGSTRNVSSADLLELPTEKN